MKIRNFSDQAPGKLVEISGSDPVSGTWKATAFQPHSLPNSCPALAAKTFNQVANARAALAALDSLASSLPNPRLFRHVALRGEAQSTSALEGTFAPLVDVLTAEAEAKPGTSLAEIQQYIKAADQAYEILLEGRPISAGLISDIQGQLMIGTSLEKESGKLRERQVVIGPKLMGDSIQEQINKSRFIPGPPGDQLKSDVNELVNWIKKMDLAEFDPIVGAAMAHYQFETIHPFVDGNGRVGRLLVILVLLSKNVISEPTLTVSPWFEKRRDSYFDSLLNVSMTCDWDSYIQFFAQGIEASALNTLAQVKELIQIQSELRAKISQAGIRAESAFSLVDLAVGQPAFSVGRAAEVINVSFQRTNKLVTQLVELNILECLNPDGYKRLFYSPRILNLLQNSFSGKGI